MALASPQIAVADLRRWLVKMQAHGRRPGCGIAVDIAEVDAHVPGGGLALGHFHEVIEVGAAREFGGLVIYLPPDLQRASVGRSCGAYAGAISLRRHLRVSASITTESSTARPGRTGTYCRR